MLPRLSQPDSSRAVLKRMHLVDLSNLLAHSELISMFQFLAAVASDE